MTRDPLYALIGQQCRVVDAKTKEGLALYEGSMGVVRRYGERVVLRIGFDKYLPLDGEHAVIVEPCDP